MKWLRKEGCWDEDRCKRLMEIRSPCWIDEEKYAVKYIDSETYLRFVRSNEFSQKKTPKLQCFPRFFLGGGNESRNPMLKIPSYPPPWPHPAFPDANGEITTISGSSGTRSVRSTTRQSAAFWSTRRRSGRLGWREMKRGSPRRSSPRGKGGVDTITSTPILAKKNVEETSASRHQHANKRRKRTQDSPRTPFDRDGSNSVGSDDVVDAEENAILEEEQLRREREAAEEAKKDAEWDPSKQNDDGLDDDEAVARPKVVDMAKYEALENEKFEQLNHLLDQTNLYSKFLSEQMDEIEQGLDAELEGSGGKKKGKKGKKGKKAAPMETQGHLLPLMRGGTLREYQMKGIKWILSLWQNGLNGILADQMGLGKTVQAIGFISHLWHKNIVGPFIVIAPLSTLSNWINEFKRWTPDIPVCLYHGNADERADIRMKALKNPGSPT